MCLLQVGSIDGSKRLRYGCPDDTGIDKISNLIEQLVLREDVGRIEERSGKHELPVQRS
jgi:hypothetical protein